MIAENPLLIISVHNHSLKWWELQQRFISSTTANYIHVVCLNNVSEFVDDKSVGGKAIVLDAHVSGDFCKNDHLRSLSLACEYAKKNFSRYRGVLVLAQDCFPIANWENKLKKIEGHNSFAILKPEVFRTRIEPTAIYTTDVSLLEFEISKIENMLGEEEELIVSCSDSFYPLLRTNKYNIHPTAAGVYYNSFYHHSAEPSDLVKFEQYYRRSTTKLDGIFQSPEKFLSSL
jgi:hypothetical protein